MTQPPPSGSHGEPNPREHQPPQPPEGQQPWSGAQHGQPPAQQPWAGQPPQQPWAGQPPQQPWAGQPPQQQWTPPPGPQQQGQWDYLNPGQGPAPQGYGQQPPRRRRGPLVIAAVAVVALVGGGAATYVAVSDKGSTKSGASNPQDAVASIVSDLNKSDVLGLLDHLAPAERAALVNPIKDSLDTEKRLHVLKFDTDLSNVSGAKFDAQNIVYDKSPEQINDHVQIVKVTGGTISVNSDLSKIPFTDEFLKAAFPHGLPTQQNKTATLDLAKIAQDSDGPVRIATQKVDGKWYPSILYTIADYATKGSGGANPTQSDYVAPNGASSAKDAVKSFVDAAVKQDYKRLIELASPEELAAVHDYAGLILKNVPTSSGASNATVKDLQLNTKSASGGATRVTLKSITVSVDGQDGTVAIDGNCVQISGLVPGTEKFCAADAVTQIEKGLDKVLTADQKTALEHLFSGLSNIGVDATQSGGKWYVNPIRSYLDLSDALLSGLQNNDLLTLLSLIPR